LLSLGADVNAETSHPGFTALAAASAGNTTVQPDIVKLLLEAKADASIAFSLPQNPNGAKQTAQEWASQQGRKALKRLFNDASKDDKDDKKKTERLFKEGVERGMAALRLIRASLQAGGDVAALAEQVATDAAARPHPRGERSTLGGRCRLQGLQGAAELNGKTGHIVSWNADGRRRYGVKLEHNEQMISCQMRNAAPVDEPRIAYPHDFDCTSAEFVAALQAELRAAGSTRIVLDWTPLAATVSDVVYLLYLAHDLEYIAAIVKEFPPPGDGSNEDEAAKAAAAAQDVVIVVVSTPETAPFFLAHRELIAFSASMHSSAELAALPWLAFSTNTDEAGKPHGLTLVPQPWELCCKREYMVRLCVHLSQRTFTCAICLEEHPYIDNPSQLPCAHFTCTSCLKRLCPPMSAAERVNHIRDPERVGITCPVCRAHFPKHSLGEHAAAPGGVALFESV